MTNPIDAAKARMLSGPTLRPWDVVPAVVELQELLRAHGFRVPTTGEFGSQTEDAVKIFQVRHGLRADAIVGPKTWAVLKHSVQPGSRTLRLGWSGVDVYELQGLLLVNGYSLPRDGLFTEATQAAVRDFQATHKLRETGMVDRVTWSLLSNKR